MIDYALLVDGHTIVTADLDGDGKDEIVAGCRQGPKAVYIYIRWHEMDANEHWTRAEWRRRPAPPWT